MKKHSDTELSKLQAVLRGQPHEEADRLREVWELAGSEEITASPDPAAVSRVWERVQAFVAPAAPVAPALPRANRGSRPHRKERLRVLAVCAAVGAVLIAGAVGLASWLRPVVWAAAPGQRLAVVLPDGSEAELNSGSSLRYRRFGRMRAVHLEGEAFFSVAKAPRPFVVYTFNARVSVLGTRFNVRAWPAGLEQSTTVSVQAGHVAFAPAARPDQAVTLTPGQVRRVTAHGVPLGDAASVEEATAWRRGDVFFKNEPLGVILDDVARRFAVDLQIHPETLRHRRWNLALRQPADAEAVVRDLAAALRLNYRASSNGYELYERPRSSQNRRRMP